jgi:hypothetical protein
VLLIFTDVTQGEPAGLSDDLPTAVVVPALVVLLIFTDSGQMI